MNGLINNMLSGLFFSGSIVLVLLGMVLLSRWWLVRNNYSRSMVLKLWLAVPLGLLISVIAMSLVKQEIYLAPVIINLPGTIDAFSQTVKVYHWRWVLLVIWLLVAAGKLAQLMQRYQQTKRRILTQAEHIKDNIYHTQMNITPMALGLVKPVIVLPEYLLTELTARELKLVILHEQIHCRRYDPFWRMTLETASCLYWFLPLKRLSKTALIEDQEFSCDEQVINHSQEITSYAQLLLNLSLSLHSRQSFNSPLLCSSSFNLKERIMKLKLKQNKRHQGIIISMFLITVFSVSSVSALPKIESSDTAEIKLVAVQTANPKYPLAAYQEKLSGEVKLSFLVTTEGKVKEIEVIEANPEGVFDEAAIKALEQFIYQPIAKELKAQTNFLFNLD